MEKETMEKYYKFRKELHKLYDNDVYSTGDLCSRLLEIRDKEKVVESISVDLASYCVSIELDKDTTLDKKETIINKMRDSIGRYIINNKDTLDSSLIKDPEFESFLCSYRYCDIITIGQSVTFNL